MDDIVPGLLEDMTNDFQSQYDSSSKIKSLKKKLDSGEATYKEANEYASEVGKITKDVYTEHLKSDNLPDGKCYYNIAERVTSTTLHNQYELVADYSEQVQTDLNKKAGIGIKAQRADEDTESYHSLANYMSAAEDYDDVAKSTAQSAERMARETVDRSVKKNAEFQSKAGMRPKIVRSGGSGCCAWCSGLSGTYDYPKVPKDVYARHNNCTCTVEYDPGSGKRQDVHTKQWRYTDSETLQMRKIVGLDTENKHAKITHKKRTANFRKEGSFDSKADPMADAFGAGIVSNPKEIEQFRKECEALGVEIIERENEALGYFPNAQTGYPGQLSVSTGASYSAWCHEMQHMYDDRDSGWNGAKIAWDRDEHYEWEKRAYGVEIDLAEKLGRPDIADKLRANLKEERDRIYGSN